MSAQTRSAADGGVAESPGFDRPPLHKVRFRRSVIYGLWIIGGNMLVPLALGLYFSVLAAHRTELLLAHGVHTRAMVQALCMTRGRSGPDYEVEYSFAVPGSADPVKAALYDRATINQAQVRNMFVGSTLDILVLPSRPDISMLEIKLGSPGPWYMLESAAITVGLFAIPGGLFLARLYWRERQLLQSGLNTEAVVKAIYTVKTFTFVSLIARFEFRDSTGTLHDGWARNVGMASQQVVGSSTRSFAAGDTATAIYDPTDPARADLYPLRLLTLAS